ncbi:hypothetical protein JOM56_009929 [Amanita muscaria]
MTKAPPTPPPTPLVTARQYLPATPMKKTALIHIETPEQQEAVGGGRTEGERSQSQGGGGGRGAKNGRRRMETKEEEEKERLKKRRNDGSTQELEEGELPSKDDAKDRSREALRIDTATALSEKRRHGPLDLSNTTRPPPSPLASISSPKPELNVGAKEGKFRYDRDFLMQFMSICKEKPDSLPPLDAIGLDLWTRWTSAPSQQASIGGGLPGGAPRGQFQSMGSFTTTPSKRALYS